MSESSCKFYPYRTDEFYENWTGCTVSAREWAERLEGELSDAKSEILRLTQLANDGIYWHGEADKCKRETEQVKHNAVELLLRCDKHPGCTIQELRDAPCSLCAKKQIENLNAFVVCANEFAEDVRAELPQIESDCAGSTWDFLADSITKYDDARKKISI